MIYFDLTKTRASGHQSGLMRVTRRLHTELGAAACGVFWETRRWCDVATGAPVKLTREDWLLTAELFSEPERPGWWEFLRERPARLAAIFHDAIPLRFPHITWPQSVSRHPEYMKMLAAFDQVFAVSAASQEDLLGFWRWQGVEVRAAVKTVVWGADFNRQPRRRSVEEEPNKDAAPHLLCVGILEPRKNQAFLIEVCERLAEQGERFTLSVVGRENPHFAKPVVQRLRSSCFAGLQLEQTLSDEKLQALYHSATATVFPTLAEGCGLPVLESLWMGTPCVYSDLPVLREIGEGGGCVAVPVNEVEAWTHALRRILTDGVWRAQLRRQISARDLPTWADAARAIRASLCDEKTDGAA